MSLLSVCGKVMSRKRAFLYCTRVNAVACHRDNDQNSQHFNNIIILL